MITDGLQKSSWATSSSQRGKQQTHADIQQQPARAPRLGEFSDGSQVNCEAGGGDVSKLQRFLCLPSHPAASIIRQGYGPGHWGFSACHAPRGIRSQHQTPDLSPGEHSLNLVADADGPNGGELGSLSRALVGSSQGWRITKVRVRDINITILRKSRAFSAVSYDISANQHALASGKHSAWNLMHGVLEAIENTLFNLILQSGHPRSALHRPDKAVSNIDPQPLERRNWPSSCRNQRLSH